MRSSAGFIIIIFYYWWGETKSLGTAATSGLLYKPQMIDEDDFWSNWWKEDWQGKPKYFVHHKIVLGSYKA
jgi:hypothetical protein